jgi:hypothetical protein
VADVQCVKATVGQYNVFALALQVTHGSADGFSGKNFGLGGPHRNCLRGHPRRCFSDGFEEFVAGNGGSAALHDYEAARDISDVGGFYG